MRYLLLLFIYSIGLSSYANHEQLQQQLSRSKNAKDSIKSFLKISEYYRLKQPSKGLKYAHKAQLMSNRLKDTVLMIKSGNKLAIIQKENSLYSSALGTVIQSISLAEKIENEKLVAEAKLVAGHVYSNLGKNNKAVEEYEAALGVFQSAHDSSGVSYVYSGLGIVYYDKGEYNAALKYYLNAEKYWVDGETSLKADLWNNIGALYQDLEDYKKAEKYYNKALRFYEVENWSSDISMVNYNLGELFLNQEQSNKAIYHFNKSLSIGKRIKSATEIMWAYYGLYLACKKKNNYNKALDYYENYLQLNDSIQNEQSKKEVQELEALFNKEQQLKKIKDQKLRLANSERKIYAEKTFNTIVLIIAIAFGLLLILAFLFIKKSKRANTLLVEQKDLINKSLNEKELLLKEIHHRVKNNLQVISSLLNLQKNVTESTDTHYVIEETQNRIRAIALVHQKLYQTQDFSQIDFSSYLAELVEQQHTMYRSSDVKVDIQITAPEEMQIDLDVAISVGLIATEIITNSFKYAFKKGGKNVLILELKTNSENKKELFICDSGPGIPEQILSEERESLGLDLIKVLTEQINGEVHFSNNNGACISILF